jgi:hypothetical protein
MKLRKYPVTNCTSSFLVPCWTPACDSVLSFTSTSAPHLTMHQFLLWCWQFPFGNQVKAGQTRIEVTKHVRADIKILSTVGVSTESQGWTSPRKNTALSDCEPSYDIQHCWRRQRLICPTNVAIRWETMYRELPDRLKDEWKYIDVMALTIWDLPWSQPANPCWDGRCDTSEHSW